MELESSPLDTDTLIKYLRLLEQDCFEQPWSYQDIRSVLENGSFLILVNEKGQIQDNFMSKILENFFYHAYAIGSFCQAKAWVKLLRLGVRPKSRRQGLAKKILAHLDLMISRRFPETKSIRVELREGNFAARKLYVSCSYRVVAQKEAYYQNSVDALIMEKVWNDGISSS